MEVFGEAMQLNPLSDARLGALITYHGARNKNARTGYRAFRVVMGRGTIETL